MNPLIGFRAFRARMGFPWPSADARLAKAMLCTPRPPTPCWETGLGSQKDMFLDAFLKPFPQLRRVWTQTLRASMVYHGAFAVSLLTFELTYKVEVGTETA